jgi:hypothetical protein
MGKKRGKEEREREEKMAHHMLEFRKKGVVVRP